MLISKSAYSNGFWRVCWKFSFWHHRNKVHSKSFFNGNNISCHLQNIQMVVFSREVFIYGSVFSLFLHFLRCLQTTIRQRLGRFCLNRNNKKKCVYTLSALFGRLPRTINTWPSILKRIKMTCGHGFSWMNGNLNIRVLHVMPVIDYAFSTLSVNGPWLHLICFTCW